PEPSGDAARAVDPARDVELRPAARGAHAAAGRALPALPRPQPDEQLLLRLHARRAAARHPREPLARARPRAGAAAGARDTRTRRGGRVRGDDGAVPTL